MEVIHPKSLTDRVALQLGIKTKVLADGSTGECHAFNIAQSIDVAADYANGVIALGYEATQHSKFRLGELNNEQADAVMVIIEKVCRGIYQELKNLNKPNYKNSNVAGFDVDDNGKCVFPVKFEDWVTLFGNVNTWYLSFTSPNAPIEGYLVAQGYVMANLATNLAGAVTKKANAKQNHRDSVAATAQKNEANATGELNSHKIADFLQNRHPNDGRALGAYGFDTSDAPSLEYDQMSGLPIGVNKQLQHIVPESIMTNMTADPIIVFKGTKKTGTGVTIPGFGELAMTKGYSKAIVTGTNPLKPGIVKTRVKR